MTETINIILEYLHRHHFTKAEAALEAEVRARERDNAPLPLSLNDDLDLDATIYLQTMQERAAQEQQKLDTERWGQETAVTELKQQMAAWQVPEKERVLSEMNKRWPVVKVEDPKALFMEFMGGELESHDSQKPVLGPLKNRGSLPPVTHAQVSEMVAVLPEKSLCPAEVSQIDTEVQPSSSNWKSSSQENEEVDATLFPQGINHEDSGTALLVRMEKGPTVARDVCFQEPTLEPPLGKVEALKQRWESKKSDKAMLNQEEGNAAGARRVVVQKDKGVTQQERASKINHGPHVPDKGIVYEKTEDLKEQVSLCDKRSSFHHEIIMEVDLLCYGQSEGEELAALSRDKGIVENGFTDNNSIGLNVAGWNDAPITTNFPHALPKTSSSLAPDSGVWWCVKEQCQDSRVDQGSCKAVSKHGLSEQDSESQGAGVSQDEGGGQPVGVAPVGEKGIGSPDAKVTVVTQKISQEELPKLPPVRVRSVDSKPSEAPGKDGCSEEGARSEVVVLMSTEATPFGLGSYVDIPIGQDISSSGTRRLSATTRPSVSHGIVEESSETLSGFSLAGNIRSESAVDYPDDDWYSDTYEDDDDPGYHRQPIEDEEWFLAHEIDYPSEDECARPSLENVQGPNRGKEFEKYDDDDRSFVDEEHSYFSGEEYYRMKEGKGRRDIQAELDQIHTNELFGHIQAGELDRLQSQVPLGNLLLNQRVYDSQLLDAKELNLTHSEPLWEGFVAPKAVCVNDEGLEKPLQSTDPGEGSTFKIGDDRLGSMCFGGVGIHSDLADFGSKMRESFVGGSSEGNLEIGGGGYGGVQPFGQTSSLSQVDRFGDVEQDSRQVPEPESATGQDEENKEDELILRYYNNSWARHKQCDVERQGLEKGSLQLKHQQNGEALSAKVESNETADDHFQEELDMGERFGFGGFSFPSPSTSGGDIAVSSRADSGKSLWSVRDISAPARGEEGEDNGRAIMGPNDTLASWRRKSNESSPIISSLNEALCNLAVSTRSTGSSHASDGYGNGRAKEEEVDDEEGEEEELLDIDEKTAVQAEAVAAEDEEAAVVLEQTHDEEDEFETFNLKIVHRKNRTGFEEDKDFPVVINAVIAGRYHVTEYLGSAAFSKAIQAHDLHTGVDVCMKIIKNNKDFFDQSLDEIKLLKFINKHDPGDKHHVLRLYDYFYHREHLFIVCELLRANLYEFHKYNRESGGEVYFTMPRLQSITRQCLEALEFIHGLGLIHCDLKPENILVKSYSRCEVKVIDFGSSCFQTDHLCSYVQSRSYRAPEVILGLPYDQKIDMWSLGCIIAELCSGNVLFQNDSLATLLARVVGILGPIDPELLSKGRDTHKFFTKNHMLYERNQDTDQLEYLLPKKTSLAHRLPMGDQCFTEFMGYLLQINSTTRPTASEALKHPWLSYPYEPISS